MYGNLSIFTGNANPELAKEICDHLKVPLGQAQVMEFSNENIFIRIKETVREQDVFVVQSLSTPVNHSIMELLIMIDALKRASAARITAVVPYYAYGRTDKKDQPRVPITARLLADIITAAGANRVLTMDLHAGQIQGFFSIPVDELSALRLLTDYFIAKQLGDIVVVSPDLGSAKKARNFAEHLHAPLAIIEKRRMAAETDVLNVIGNVDNRQVIIVDDEIDTAGSVMSAITALQALGATEFYTCCTHPILSGPAIERLREAPIKEFVATNTVPLPPHKRLGNMTILSVAPLLGEAIRRIHTGGSVGQLFR
ncbi:MAG: ribose-phosphate pyrophosphokinase [Dehalococcoidales bacterium]|nr:ribose-phosphate pyrophosphokinase [Dehalococcoidales bacterium]